MAFLPTRRSKSWIWICTVHAILVCAALLASRAVLHIQMSMQAGASLFIIAVSLALIACVGGWLGGRLFFSCSAAGSLIGAAYMLYVSVFDASPGWSDLASLIGFMVISAVGISAGLVAELVRFLIKRKNY